MPKPILLAVALSGLAVLPALAQDGAGHAGHHPGAAPAASPARPAPAAAARALSGRGMMAERQGVTGGRQGMMGTMMDQAQPCPAGDLAALKTALEITPAQTAVWNVFADALRAESPMAGMRGRMMGVQADTAAARLDGQEKMLGERLEAVRKLKAALAPLYAALTPAQKAKADARLCGGRPGMNMARGD